MERNGEAGPGMEWPGKTGQGLPLVREPIPDETGLSVGRATDLELALYAMLEELGYTRRCGDWKGNARLGAERQGRERHGEEFIEEWQVPGSLYRLDAYVPSTRTGYEADGPLHVASRDRKRDKWIVENSEVERIIRLRYKELAPWL